MATLSIRDEATELLRELLRLNTVNPPGNETVAAELLRDYLEPFGVECELLGRVPERKNLVARLPGRGDGPRLLLLSHTDTVVADADEWSVDPWGGELREEHVWGRGALDMKGQVAASAVAIATLAREGFGPAGDILFAATADEEVGEEVAFGLSWLCEAHPEVIRAQYCLNEGGGDRISFGGRTYYLCSTSEKMSSPFRIRVHGRAAHASMPGIADNALVRAAPLIERLGAYDPAPRLLPEVEEFLRTLLGRVPEPDQVVDELRDLDAVLAGWVEPMLALTISPTIIEASRARNVIPSAVDLVCDCRLLPGQSRSEAEADIRATLGEDHYDFDWLEAHGGTRSSMHTPLWEAVASFVTEEEPDAALVPIVLPGFTDSHYLREAFGTIAYGFFPMRTMDPELAARLVHSADERIHVADLEYGARFLIHAARTREA